MRFVLVEDSPAYSLLVTAWLEDLWGEPVTLERFERVGPAADHLSDALADCVLLDLSLPDADGLSAVEQVQAAAPGVPIVVLSGDSDEELALRAMQDGVQDYLLKDKVDGALLMRSVRYAIERKRTQVELSRLALHDPLTGLPNRNLLSDRLALALARAHRSKRTVGMLFLDLDRFKLVNDSLGHEAGDDLLCQVAKRLEGVVRPSDTVARFGGDELCVLCDDVNEAVELVGVAERVVEAIGEPMWVRGHELFLTTSVGVAVSEAGTEDAETLIRNADAAMYRAKERGGARVELYDHDMQQRVMRRMRLEHDLHRALRKDELRLHYQPIRAFSDETIVGVEALVRWEHPERGLLPPTEFIDLAEETGQIKDVGGWVLRTACEQLAEWHDAWPELRMSVNVSPRQLVPEFAQSVADAIGDAGVDPERLTLELTESKLLEEEATIPMLESLKAIGVEIAVDDFGSGYSSLSYLDRFPVDVLKIDKTFVSRLGQDAEGGARIVTAVIALARAFGLTAVAEGVERADQSATLESLGCDLGQGFLWARPQEPDALTALLQDQPAHQA